MTADLTKRIMVRVTEDQLAWIGQMAADEGMDNATFVRVVLDRLSKGRAPLISMMEAAPVQVLSPPLETRGYTAQQQLDHLPMGQATEILADRVAQAEAQIPDSEQQPQHVLPTGEVVAIPMRRVQRERYNPGRN